MSVYYYVLDAEIDQCTINIKSGFPVPIGRIEEDTGRVFSCNNIVVGNIYDDLDASSIADYNFDLDYSPIQLPYVSIESELPKKDVDELKQATLDIWMEEVDKEIERLKLIKKILKEKEKETWILK